MGLNTRILGFAILLLTATSAQAQNWIYVSNASGSSVSVIDPAAEAIVASIGVGLNPWGVAITPDGSRAYVANSGESSVSVINTVTNSVTATIAVGAHPFWVAITPDGTHAYVSNRPGGPGFECIRSWGAPSLTFFKGGALDVIFNIRSTHGIDANQAQFLPRVV